MVLSDQQLMLLEQLTYLEDVFTDNYQEKLGIVLPENASNLGQYVDVITKNAEVMKKLREKSGAFTSGEEWTAILEAISKDEDLRRLVPYDNNSSVYAQSFQDPDDQTKGVVIFKGTADAYEWDDDVRGLNLSDTPSQINARNYIQGLPFDSITVAGHSKGGNKAQYVTIVCDKVDYCVSMDGQGFSQEFMNKYWAEIGEKGDKIKNYSLDADYVHILLFPVPGAEQIYIASDPNDRGLKNHSPSELLTYEIDENGNLCVKIVDGNPWLEIVSNELPAITYLRQLTYFVINTGTYEQKQQLAELIGPVLAVVMCGYFEYEGVGYTADNILDYIASKSEAIAILIAFLTKYIKVYKLDGEKVNGVLEAFGMFLNFKGGKELLNILSEVVRFVLGNLDDMENDKILEGVLALLSHLLGQNFGVDLDLVTVWQQVEQVYGEIQVHDSSTANQMTQVRKEKIRDFSRSVYDIIMGTINKVGELTYDSVSQWSVYETESWYNDLSIRAFKNGIFKYYQGLSDINASCKTSIEKIFSDAKALDSQYANKVSDFVNQVNEAKQKFLS